MTTWASACGRIRKQRLWFVATLMVLLILILVWAAVRIVSGFGVQIMGMLGTFWG